MVFIALFKISLLTSHAEGNASAEWHEPIKRGFQGIVTRQRRLEAPNITLNSHTESRTEVRLAAAGGVLFQMAVIVWAACATYLLRYPKDGTDPIGGYAFPCFVSGTLTLAFGLTVCGNVVETRTTEKVAKARDECDVHHIWLQRKANVGDQVFKSAAIFTKTSRKDVLMSQRSTSSDFSNFDYVIFGIPLLIFRLRSTIFKPKGISKKENNSELDENSSKEMDECAAMLASKATFGMSVGLVGFIVQFVGLRGVHWSVSIAQLGAVLLVTSLRLYVRRGHARPPRSESLTSGFELDWFAMQLTKNQCVAPWLGDHDSEDTAWNIVTGVKCQYEALKPQDQFKEHPSVHITFVMRKELGILTGWRSLVFSEASILKKAIELTMDSLVGGSPDYDPTLIWRVQVQHATSTKPEPILFRLSRTNGRWVADLDEIEAALSLWLYSVDYDCFYRRASPHLQSGLQAHGHADSLEGGPKYQTIGQNPEEADQWLSAEGPSTETNLRLLGPASLQLRRDLRWWMPRNTGKFLQIREDISPSQGSEEVGKSTFCVEAHRVFGHGTRRGMICRPTTSKIRFETRADNLEINFDAHTGNFSRHSNAFNHSSNISDEERSSSPGGSDESPDAITATESYRSFKSLCALDLFTNFMWALAKTLRGPIEGNADLQNDDISDSGSWRSFTLSNKRLSKLANDLQGIGLGNAEEVYVSIIPALSTEDKLPRPYSVIELARSKAKVYEQQGNLLEAGKIYLWMVRALSTFGDGNDVAAQATAGLVDHLRQVIAEIKYRETSYNQNYQELTLLRRRRQDTETYLRNNKLFPALLFLYDFQERPWDSAEHPFEDIRVACSKDTECNISDADLFSALHITHVHEFARDKFGFTRALEKDPADSKDILGWTPCHYAAAFQQSRAIYKLTATADINAKDVGGFTPLHYACMGGDEDVVRGLLDQGADIEAQARDGSRPMHCAAYGGHGETVTMLLEAGATIGVFTSGGNTPLMLAVMEGHEKIVRMLYDDAGNKLRGRYGRTLLHLAALFGRAEAWERLFPGSTSPNSTKHGRMGWTH